MDNYITLHDAETNRAIKVNASNLKIDPTIVMAGEMQEITATTLKDVSISKDVEPIEKPIWTPIRWVDEEGHKCFANVAETPNDIEEIKKNINKT